MSRNVFHYYDVDEKLQILGEGAFGTVRHCVQKSTGLEFAVKIIKKQSESAWQDVLEAKILRKLKHPNIVVLHESFQGNNHLYLVFDLVTGGELYDDIVARYTYSEADASYAMEQILEAIKYCHQKGVVHSDLKPNNILLASKMRGATVKIADFGLSFEVKGDERGWFGGCGTLDHMSPELLNQQPYGKPVDIWACGIILYNLLVGEQPFSHDDDSHLEELIKTGKYYYPSEIKHTISPVAKDFIKHMLCVDSYKRFTAAQALRHPWIHDRNRLVPKNHLPETIVNLKKFNARRKFKAGILAAMAAKRLFKKSPVKTNGGTKAPIGSLNTVRGDLNRQKEEIIRITSKLTEACNNGDNEVITRLCDPHVRDILVNVKEKMEFQMMSFANTACRTCVSMKTEMLHPDVFMLGDNAACISYYLIYAYTCHFGHSHRHPHLIEETRVWHKRGGKWKVVHFHSSETDRQF